MDAGLNETRMKMLGQFAEMSLVLARDLQQSALVAEDADEKVRLASAFHRIGRGLRQSLALHARIERDAERDVLEDLQREAKAETARRDRRKTHIKAAVERLIWSEHEGFEDPEAEPLLDRLDLLLDAEAELEGFDHTDPDEVIARIAQTLKLPDPPPQGEVSPQVTEGVEAHDPPSQGEVSPQVTEGVEAQPPPNRPASQPPQSLRDSSPSGGASGGRPSG